MPDDFTRQWEGHLVVNGVTMPFIQWVFVLDQRVFVLDQWVFILDHRVFVLDQWVFVSHHWVFVLDHRVLGLRSSFLGLRFRNT